MDHLAYGAPRHQPSGTVVLLADGGYLAVNSLTSVDGDQLVLSGGDVVGSQKVVLGDVLGWHELATEAHQLAPLPEHDVVWTDQGPLSGRVLALSSDKLQFQHSDLGHLDLATTKIRGLRLAIPVQQPTLSAKPRWTWRSWSPQLRLDWMCLMIRYGLTK